MKSLTDQIAELVTVAQATAAAAPTVERIAADLVACLKNGGKVLTCGNGGSACDADHFAEELVGRYRSNRQSLPALNLAADGALLTCIGNDFGFDRIFSRQVESLLQRGDMLFAFSSSGSSANIALALEAAAARGAATVAFLGKDGGRCVGLAKHEIIVPSHNTARIQEMHTVFLHTLCEAVEAAFPPTSAP